MGSWAGCILLQSRISPRAVKLENGWCGRIAWTACPKFWLQFALPEVATGSHSVFPRAPHHVHNFSNATKTWYCPVVAVVLPSLEIQKSKIVPWRETQGEKSECSRYLRPLQKYVAQGLFAYPLGSIGEG